MSRAIPWTGVQLEGICIAWCGSRWASVWRVTCALNPELCSQIFKRNAFCMSNNMAAWKEKLKRLALTTSPRTLNQTLNSTPVRAILRLPGLVVVVVICALAAIACSIECLLRENLVSLTCVLRRSRCFPWL